jgi:anti-anti-sigma factor
MSETPAPMPVTIERHGSALLVRIPLKTPTEAEMTLLSQKIDQAAREPGITLIAIDLSGVEMLPSLGLGTLVQISNKCKARQQKLKLAACNPKLRQTFTVTRLDRFFDLVDQFAPGMQ